MLATGKLWVEQRQTENEYKIVSVLKIREISYYGFKKNFCNSRLLPHSMYALVSVTIDEKFESTAKIGKLCIFSYRTSRHFSSNFSSARPRRTIINVAILMLLVLRWRDCKTKANRLAALVEPLTNGDFRYSAHTSFPGHCTISYRIYRRNYVTKITIRIAFGPCDCCT